MQINKTYLFLLFEDTNYLMTPARSLSADQVEILESQIEEVRTLTDISQLLMMGGLTE